MRKFEKGFVVRVRGYAPSGRREYVFHRGRKVGVVRRVFGPVSAPYLYVEGEFPGVGERVEVRAWRRGR